MRGQVTRVHGKGVDASQGPFTHAAFWEVMNAQRFPADNDALVVRCPACGGPIGFVVMRDRAVAALDCLSAACVQPPLMFALIGGGS